MASLRRRLSSEEGSFLIEALVTAAILLVVSAGVMLALQTAHAQSALQRSKALATDVAQTKLDELRSRAYNDLRPLNETSTVVEGGMTFTVLSTASKVAQAGAPSGCDNQRARDYMSLKTTVTWAKMGSRKPVVLDTLVAAPVGAGGGLIVNVTGGAGQAVPNIPITLSSGGGSATTDASGCARWDAVAAGTGYGLTASVAGYVQPNGEQAVAITPIAIVAEETAQTNFAYDRGGSLGIRFQQRRYGATTATDVPDPVTIGAVSLSNASATVVKGVGAGTGTTGTAGLFYPFPSSYAVYADTCPAARPGTTPAVTVPAGGSVSTVLELPSLNVRVQNNGSSTLPTDTVVRVKTACGTVYDNLTVRPADGTLTNPGFPWGAGFQVCASSASANRRARISSIDNKTYAAPTSGGTLLNMQAPVSGNACPF
jgi:hypothetical protein